MLHIQVPGLEAHIQQVVEAKVAEALAAREEDPWHTFAEAAQYLRVAVGTIHDLVSSRRLPRHGGRKEKIRLRRSELDAYIEAKGR